MTTFALFLFMIVALAATLKKPLIGAIVYIWLACSHLQTGNTGIFAFDWSLIAMVVFTISYIFNSGKNFSIKSSIFVYVLAFYTWTTLTLSVAMVPPVANHLWWDFTRVIVAFVVIGGAISTREDLNFIVWAMLAGVAAVIASGVAQVLVSGGASHVFGVPGSEFAGNNEVARLFGCAGMPFALFFSFHSQSAILRRICYWTFLGSVVAIIGTFSLGAFVALVAVYLFWTLISRKRVRFLARGAIVAVLIVIAFSATEMSSYFSRIATIEEYQTDRSFEGREFAWNFAQRTVANHPLMGGGFGVFRLDKDPLNIDGTGDWKDAHSIYFEPLAEHGYVGLSLYLLMLFGAFAKAQAIKRRCRGSPQFYWERDLATAAQMALVFHMVGGLTISTTYVQYLFFILTIIASLDKITSGVKSARGKVRAVGRGAVGRRTTQAG